MSETRNGSVLTIETQIKKHKKDLSNLKNDLKRARTQLLLGDLEPQVLAVVKAGRADEFKQALKQLLNEFSMLDAGAEGKYETGPVHDTDSEKGVSEKSIKLTGRDLLNAEWVRIWK